MEHQSYVLLCTETTVSNPPVVFPKSSCDVHLFRRSLANVPFLSRTVTRLHRWFEPRQMIPKQIKQSLAPKMMVWTNHLSRLCTLLYQNPHAPIGLQVVCICILSLKIMVHNYKSLIHSSNYFQLKISYLLLFLVNIVLTLKEAGEDQSVPLVRRLVPISHRIMLWSQKFLTFSINISSISW